MLSISVKTLTAVAYPGRDALDRTLAFSINAYQLPVNQAFYVLLDAGDQFMWCTELYVF